MAVHSASPNALVGMRFIPRVLLIGWDGADWRIDPRPRLTGAGGRPAIDHANPLVAAWPSSFLTGRTRPITGVRHPRDRAGDPTSSTPLTFRSIKERTFVEDLLATGKGGGYAEVPLMLPPGERGAPSAAPPVRSCPPCMRPVSSPFTAGGATVCTRIQPGPRRELRSKTPPSRWCGASGSTRDSGPTDLARGIAASRRRVGGRKDETRTPASGPDASEILRARFARGEITEDEHRKSLTVLDETKR